MKKLSLTRNLNFVYQDDHSEDRNIGNKSNSNKNLPRRPLIVRHMEFQSTVHRIRIENDTYQRINGD